MTHSTLRRARSDMPRWWIYLGLPKITLLFTNDLELVTHFIMNYWITSLNNIINVINGLKSHLKITYFILVENFVISSY